VIRGHAEILLERYGQNEIAWRDAAAIQKAADRAASITRQLLAFSRKQVLQPRVLDLCGVVAETSDMLRKLIGSDIALHLNLERKALWIRADEGQIEQVVVNLVVNARDAMPRGGTLTVEACRVSVAQNFVRQGAPVPAGNFVRLTVRDTGIGMDAAIQSRIFEPFFTTKAAGKGTGLGLATVFGIIKQSGGWIWVESVPGQGASFEVLLPEVPTPEAPPPAEPAARHSPRGTETILVVDDEESVRDLASSFLRSQGYSVLAAQGGPSALEVAEGHAGPIEALITDAVMPGMDGVTVARRVSEIKPGIKVLYISGYAGSVAALDDAIARGEPFLQKPFTLDALARKLREMLA
jgi:CheY-like chemotaxis protein